MKGLIVIGGLLLGHWAFAQTDSTINFNANVYGKWNFYNDFNLWGNKTFYTDGNKEVTIKNSVVNSRLQLAISECNGCYHQAAARGDIVLRKLGNGRKFIIGNGYDFEDPLVATGILGSYAPIGLWIYNSGNALIGAYSETLPIAKLQVDGSSIVGSRLQIGNTNSKWLNNSITGWANGLNETDAALFVPVNQNAVSDLRLYIPDDADDAFSIWGNTCVGGNCTDLNAASRIVKFRGDGNVFFNGNVGIGLGDALPDQKLVVGGTIRAEEVKVETITATQVAVRGDVHANSIKVSANGQTADFVFDEGYELKTLTEVEQYIKEHKHLPNIPSAAQMEANGVDLAEMNKLLLQKVEELTLYVIKQEKAQERDSNILESLLTLMEEQKSEAEKLKQEILSLKEKQLSDSAGKNE